MNKTILRDFAIESRKDLMEKISLKLSTFYIDETFSSIPNGDIYTLKNENHTLVLTKEEYEKRNKLLKRLKELEIANSDNHDKTPKELLIEEAAYTWFNRLIAIRYMEIHNYLPLGKNNESLGIRVLSSNDNKLEPEILKFSNLSNPNLDIGFNKEKYSEKANENDKFKYLLLLVCNKLKEVMPDVFGGNTDYIDILIPENLLADTSFISKMISKVSEDNFDQVEIIGWLYQYYNQTEKDRVIGAKKAYKKNEIPYATELFTPDWIVKYMVENSLGKFWLEHGGDIKLKENWKYFVDSKIEFKNSVSPINISFIDPCCGSGHILVYAFEVLYQIYESVGFNKKDIAESILRNNIYGLDVDDRAGQLSVLSVLLKAREYDSKLFSKDIIRNLNVMSIQESVGIEPFTIESLQGEIKEKVRYLYEQFIDGKEIGSLSLIESNDYSNVIDYYNSVNNLETMNLREYLPLLIKQSNILSKKYDIIITNPPYMNNSLMSYKLKNYLSDHFKNFKNDLFSAFIIRNSLFGTENSYLGFMTPYVWMFISSYEDLRKYIIDNLNISSLIQLEYSALEEAVVPICTFIIDNKKSSNDGEYFRLSDFTGGMKIQEKKFLDINYRNDRNYRFTKNENVFSRIEGCPIAYWITDNMSLIFSQSKKLSDYSDLRQGLITGDNNRFLRYWWEIENNYINIKWFHHNKGGEYRKWYGNQEYVLNYENDGYELKNYKVNGKLASRPQNLEYNFRKSISWSLITSGDFSARFYDESFTFNVAGLGCFPKVDSNINYILGLLNTKLVKKITKVLNPTLNMNVGDIAKVPVIIDDNIKEKVNSLVEECIKISKNDWDNFENSWDFKIHPLINMSNYINKNYINYQEIVNKNISDIKGKEEEINKLFIDLYQLNNEMDYHIENSDISLKEANETHEIKSLISYAVGCMFGRYSLDEEGLIYAGGIFDVNKYKKYPVDVDNIIPITDSNNIIYDDDIVTRFVKFIEVAFSKETLNDNLDYIAEVLGKRGTETSLDTIRRYFVNDFYNDHLKMYQGRPIYWMFDSGKKNGFKCLIYMHRYNEQTISKIRTKYLHRTQDIYQRLFDENKYRLDNDNLSSVDRKNITNKVTDLNNKLNECSVYDEKIGHIASMNSEELKIDLDNGVLGCVIKDEKGKPVKNKDGIEMRTGNYYKFIDILSKLK